MRETSEVIMDPIAALQNHVASLDDPRVARTKRHGLSDTIVIALACHVTNSKQNSKMSWVNRHWLRREVLLAIARLACG